MDIIELFAGVGGFRVGFDRVGGDYFRTIWSNQFEPATTTQHASQTYVARFGGEGHVNADIATIPTDAIPDHDMLCGGFPCQDYSVARALGQAAGIEGKKGVLWWQIERICREKGEKSAKILFLENVDRLVQSPAKQRGRDFAIILQSLANLHYVVEWRIINAAEYGMPQRRKRVYILAYKEGSKLASAMQDPTDWVRRGGVFASAFPIEHEDSSGPLDIEPFKLANGAENELVDITEKFNADNNQRPFCNAGVMKDGWVWTKKVVPDYRGTRTTIGDILATGKDRELITEEYYIPDEALPRWQYLKGAKHEERRRDDGGIYYYSEGGMAFPDPLDEPSRTIITGEGGKAPSRFKHVIVDPVDGRMRRLIPLELERLNMFPDHHTIGQSDTKRAFFMGNALVCGIVTKVGEELKRRLCDG